MILLIDIGNTRIKWARLDAGVLGGQAAAIHATWTSDEFIEAVLKSSGRPNRVLISNVGGTRIGGLARAAIVDTWRIEAEFVQSTARAGGIRNAYPEPAQLGVDRLLAMIGARAMQRGALCVVNVGTATTIDGVDAAGRHLGGVIVPGPDLMVSSLLHNTSEIAQRAQHGSSGDALFADNTLGALQQGAIHALAALVVRAVETMQQQVNETPTLLLAGGASSRLEAAIGLPCRPVPDLVLRGLAVLAGEAGAARPSPGS